VVFALLRLALALLALGFLRLVLHAAQIIRLRQAEGGKQSQSGGAERAQERAASAGALLH
jgi:hypothetical protein